MSNALVEKELIFNDDQMIDASFVLAPKQRNTREENEKIKKGEGKELWNDKTQKKIIKILMYVGHRKEERIILVTRIIPRLIRKVNL